MITRETYLKKIRPFYDDDLIKIITGIRRCGKSVILTQIRTEIAQKTNNIITLDFEDTTIQKEIPDADTLITYIENHRTEEKCYIFLDEIQRIENWPDACRTLRLRNTSVFISGSNAKLLSKEFTKELAGRHVAFQIRPFIYKEITQYCTQLHKTPDITDYLVWGGFPKRFEYDTDAQHIYLNDLIETIIINDLTTRYKIRKTDLFRKLTTYIFLSNARIFSANSIQKYLKANQTPCSLTTIIKYLGYLEEAFAIRTIPRYSQKAKHDLIFYEKIYNEDVAFNSILCSSKRYDLSHNLENIIYNELIFRGYELKVYDNKGREIDFLARKDGKEYYIQVAYSVAEDKAYERELSAFEGIDTLSRKILITNDELNYSTSTIEHIRLKDFLLKDDL